MEKIENQDEEVIKNLEILMNFDSLEQAEFWDELINLAQIETEAPEEDGGEQ